MILNLINLFFIKLNCLDQNIELFYISLGFIVVLYSQNLRSIMLTLHLFSHNFSFQRSRVASGVPSLLACSLMYTTAASSTTVPTAPPTTSGVRPTCTLRPVRRCATGRKMPAVLHRHDLQKQKQGQQL